MICSITSVEMFQRKEIVILIYLLLFDRTLTDFYRMRVTGENNLIELMNATSASSITQLKITEMDHLSPDVFNKLTNLKLITMKNNLFVELPDGIFRNNEKLKEIRFTNNRADLTTIPSGFLANLPNLSIVEIFRNRIQYLPENFLENSTNVTELSLLQNELITLPERIFSSQVNLIRLNLAQNQLNALPENLFNNTRKLQILYLSQNHLEEIDERLFTQLHHLRYLNLNHNRLKRIHSNAFNALVKLETLDLGRNRLDDYAMADGTGDHLLKKIWSIWHTNDSRLWRLDLTHNRIEYFDLDVMTLFWNRSMDVGLAFNQIKEVNITGFDAFNSSILEVFKKQNVRWTWNIYLNPIQCDCKLLKFLQFWKNDEILKSLFNIEIDAITCAKPFMPYQLIDHRPYDAFCLNKTKLSCLNSTCRTLFRYRPGITFLYYDCADNGLKEMPNLLCFNGYWSLEAIFREKRIILDINDNRIMKLPDSKTPGFAAISQINAKNNLIESINMENLPPNLEQLDISNNNVKRIDKNVLKYLGESKTLEKLELNGNPWICDCDFLQFVHTYPNKIDYKNIRCDDNEFLYKKAELCQGIIALSIVSILLISLPGFLIAILIALFYIYQQEIRVWLFAHDLLLCLVREVELDKDKKYDAFISYSHKDTDFVVEQLIPKLEMEPNPFKLCVHYRDWLVGEYIPDQIARSVEDSRRTIVVLTRNFLESIWGRMEFRAAHQKALVERRSRVIVIIYGDIGNIEKLDPDIKAYLRTNTYLEWNDPWFFDKLRYALPHTKNQRSKRSISYPNMEMTESTEPHLNTSATINNIEV